MNRRAIILVVTVLLFGSVLMNSAGAKERGRISEDNDSSQNVQQVVNVQTSEAAKKVRPEKSDYDLQWSVMKGYHGIQDEIVDAQGTNEVSYSRVAIYRREVDAVEREIARHKGNLNKSRTLLLSNPDAESFRVGSMVYSRSSLAKDVNYRIQKVAALSKSLEEKTAKMTQAEKDYQIRTQRLRSSWLATQRKKDQVRDELAVIRNYKVDRMIDAVSSDDPVAFAERKPRLARNMREWNQRVGNARGYSKVAAHRDLITSPYAEPITNFNELGTTDELLAGIDACLIE